MKVTKENLSSLIKTAFNNSDLGGKSIKRILQHAEDADGVLFSATDGVDDEDYISMIIVNAIEQRIVEGNEDTVDEAINQLNHAIKQLTIARDNLINADWSKQNPKRIDNV